MITTPFSYVATTSAIIWEKCKPVFVDIHPEYLTINESKIESAITSKTRAILATHVFGNPCNVLEIEKIAKKYNLKVIYDAAHCFGVKYKGQSIFNYGDVSTCSFHATKIFHTGEGGAIFCNNNELNEKLFYSHNFGHNGPYEFHGVGINSKMSELQAAMGLAILPHMNQIFTGRKKVVDVYNENLNFNQFRKPLIREGPFGISYYPIIFETEQKLLESEKSLNNQGVFPRRYFYPSLNTLNYVQGTSMQISESIASRILCLPLYCGLKSSEVNQICMVLNS